MFFAQQKIYVHYFNDLISMHSSKQSFSRLQVCASDRNRHQPPLAESIAQRDCRHTNRRLNVRDITQPSVKTDFLRFAQKIFAYSVHLIAKRN